LLSIVLCRKLNRGAIDPFATNHVHTLVEFDST
jgi:hypothetical protein